MYESRAQRKRRHAYNALRAQHLHCLRDLRVFVVKSFFSACSAAKKARAFFPDY